MPTLRKKVVELEEQLMEKTDMIRVLELNDAESSKKIKALNEIHSHKIKALLKSIQNLKKQVQKEKHG